MFVNFKILEFIILQKNRVIKKYFNIGAIIFALASTIFFIMQEYGNYFCFIWAGTIIIAVIEFNVMFRKRKKIDFNIEMNFFDKLIDVFQIVLGVVLLIIPYTPIFLYIGGGHDSKIDIISKLIYLIYGTCMIFMNRYVSYLLINKEKYINEH
jgi:hypothetical protein